MAFDSNIYMHIEYAGKPLCAVLNTELEPNPQMCTITSTVDPTLLTATCPYCLLLLTQPV